MKIGVSEHRHVKTALLLRPEIDGLDAIRCTVLNNVRFVTCGSERSALLANILYG